MTAGDRLAAGLLRGRRRRRQNDAEQSRSGRPRRSPRVLMILFHFPPVGGVSMPRNARNVQYLPGFGWTPVVVAPRRAVELSDEDALSMVAPGTRVSRTWWLEPRHLRPVVSLLRSLSRVRYLRRYSGSQRQLRSAATIEGLSHDRRPARPVPSRFWELHQLVFFPDPEVGWLPFAVVAALRAHRAEKVEAVYSTSAPITAHLVAGIFKRLTGVPWVAEFRDPWIGNPVAEPHPWLQRRLQARLERWIVHAADRVVFVSPSTTRLYRRRYPGAADMVTITNGHDRSEVVIRPRRSVPRRYRIVWAGALYRPAELRLFLEALQVLAARRPGLVDELEVEFYGQVSDECREVADHFMSHDPLRTMLRLRGFVARRIALEALADADSALVMLGPGAGMGQFVPGKLFECLGQSKQVLAVLPPGDARDILEDLDWGIIADPDVADIGRAIEHLLTLPPPGRLADPAAKYDRVSLAERLAETLRDASGAGRTHTSPTDPPVVALA